MLPLSSEDEVSVSADSYLLEFPSKLSAGGGTGSVPSFVFLILVSIVLNCLWWWIVKARLWLLSWFTAATIPFFLYAFTLYDSTVYDSSAIGSTVFPSTSIDCVVILYFVWCLLERCPRLSTDRDIPIFTRMQITSTLWLQPSDRYVRLHNHASALANININHWQHVHFRAIS